MAHRDDPIRIEIRIDRRTARRALVVAAVLAVSVTAGVGLAVPTTFQDGQILKAADLNGNFADLETRVAALEGFKARATKGEKYSVGGTVCGLTPKTTGDLAALPNAGSGLAKAKAACAAVAGCSPTAHMCTTEEVARSMATGTPNADATGWMMSGMMAVSLQITGYTNNCEGFTSSQVNFNGAVGNANGSYSPCSIAQPVLCCD